MKKRINLENAIFARAAQLHEKIWSKNGALLTAAVDAYLLALISVYNQFFQVENQQCFPEATEDVWANFFTSSVRFGGRLLPFQDLKSELFFESYIKQRLLREEVKKLLDIKNKL